MTRLIEPPRKDFERLLTPLTPGERQLIDLFDEELDPNWEIYVQPHLNGLRPDLVLLNPHIGIAIFEVKDWDLSAMRYFASGSPLRLMVEDKYGKKFQKENPVRKILQYKEELFELYCPRLDDKAGLAVITAGLVFTKSDRSDVEQVFESFRDDGMRKYPQYYPIGGADDLEEGAIKRIFPEYQRPSSKFMTLGMASDLRGWLQEPAFSKEQRMPLPLDEQQKMLASTRTKTGYRRIKGPAGTGKSLVLAARAAELASEGKSILVVCYNITLLNYLRDFAVRHSASRNTIRRKVAFLHFHGWCKWRVCYNDEEHYQKYKNLWASLFSDSDESKDAEQEPSSVLDEKLPKLVQSLYKNTDSNDLLPQYDAILVDEGQDFLPSWQQTLRCALVDGGEMVMVADKTQNIYSTAATWTEDVMKKAGFTGRWTELKTSYRLPSSVIPIVRAFAREFLGKEEIDVPSLEEKDQQKELKPTKLRWIQVRSNDQDRNARICARELTRMMKELPPNTAVTDITFLSNRNIGRKVVKRLKEKNIHVLNTFDKQRQKRAFFQGAAQVKATTLHSFKGWEARLLVLFVDKISHTNSKALFYTALTRLRRHDWGSCFTIVSCCDELKTFGKTHFEDFELV